MPQQIRKSAVWHYAARIHTAGQRPAAVIIGELWNVPKKGRSGKVSFPLVGKLEAKLLSLGEIGSRRHTSRIGYCAEVDAANKLLWQTNLRLYALSDIDFSPAIRPRTMQVVPRCQNCVDTFN